EPEVVEQLERVAREVLDRVAPGRGGRGAVASVLVAQHAEGARERVELRLPQLARRAERGRQDEHRCARGTVETVRRDHPPAPSSRRYRASARSTNVAAEPR